MRDLIIDEEFCSLIPELSAREFEQLEQNILEDGEVTDPIITWRGIILDGHNRWRILQKHPGIPYQVKELSCPDRYAAVAWMCKKQLGRRNLSSEQKAYLRGQQYHAEKMTQGTNNRFVQAKSKNPQNEVFYSESTAERLAKEHGVSRATIERDAKYSAGIDALKEVSKEAAEKVLNGSSGVTKAAVMEISNLDREGRRNAAERINLGESDIIPPKRERTRKERLTLIEESADADYTETSVALNGPQFFSSIELESCNYVTGLKNRIFPVMGAMDSQAKNDILIILRRSVIEPIRQVEEEIMRTLM